MRFYTVAAENTNQDLKFYNKVSGKLTKNIPDKNLLDYVYTNLKDAKSCARLICKCDNDITETFIDTYWADLWDSESILKKKGK
jgi:hypothetical protein